MTVPPEPPGPEQQPPGPAAAQPYPPPAPPPGPAGPWPGPMPPASTPPGVPSSDDRTWMMLSHLLALLGLNILGPLIVLLTKGKESYFVRDQAVESLNFQITVIVAAFAVVILSFLIIGLFLIPVLIVGAIVLPIVACVRTYRGERYRYPLNIRLVK